MKKYTYLLGAFVLLITGTSCKKSYTCQCFGPYIMQLTDYPVKAKNETKAETICLAKNDELNGPSGCHLIK